VGVALGQLNDARLEVAAQLAERFGARVIGVAAAEFSPPSVSRKANRPTATYKELFFVCRREHAIQALAGFGLTEVVKLRAIDEGGQTVSPT